ncbi:MAG: hypothetical protein ABUL71_01050, partial [Gemmatimonadota bacterium]
VGEGLEEAALGVVERRRGVICITPMTGRDDSGARPHPDASTMAPTSACVAATRVRVVRIIYMEMK